MKCKRETDGRKLSSKLKEELRLRVVRRIVPLFLRKLVLGIKAQASGKNDAATIASGGPDSSSSPRTDPTRGSVRRLQMTLRRVAMPCSFSSQATKNRPALRLSGTKNLRFTMFRFQDFQRLIEFICSPKRARCMTAICNSSCVICCASIEMS
jgi:hypothetical protein